MVALDLKVVGMGKPVLILMLSPLVMFLYPVIWRAKRGQGTFKLYESRLCTQV